MLVILMPDATTPETTFEKPSLYMTAVLSLLSNWDREIILEAVNNRLKSLRYMRSVLRAWAILQELERKPLQPGQKLKDRAVTIFNKKKWHPQPITAQDSSSCDFNTVFKQVEQLRGTSAIRRLGSLAGRGEYNFKTCNGRFSFDLQQNLIVLASSQEWKGLTYSDSGVAGRGESSKVSNSCISQSLHRTLADLRSSSQKLEFLLAIMFRSH